MSKYVNDSLTWLPCEDEFLARNRGSVTMDVLSTRLGRSPKAVQQRAMDIGLTKAMALKTGAPLKHHAKAPQ